MLKKKKKSRIRETPTLSTNADLFLPKGESDGNICVNVAVQHCPVTVQFTAIYFSALQFNTVQYSIV